MPTLEGIVKRTSYLRSAILGLALSVSLHAQLTFNQTASTTLLDQKVIGTAIKNDGFADNIYVAADGNVQKYDTSFNTVGSSISDLEGVQTYMNSGLGNTLSFSTFNTGLRDMNISDSTPAGLGYGSSQAFSLSRQVVSGGNTYQVLFDTNLSGVVLYNKTQDISTFLISSIDLGNTGSWLVDFAEIDETNIMNSNFIAARQDGFIQEVNLTNGLTSNSGTLSMISGGTLTAVSYDNSKIVYASFNENLGDFGTSRIDYGGFAGYSEVGSVVPESSTYGATFMGLTALLFALRKRKGVKDLVSRIKNYRLALVNKSLENGQMIPGSVSLSDAKSVMIMYDRIPKVAASSSQLNVTYAENSQIVSHSRPVASGDAKYLAPHQKRPKSDLILTR